MKVKWIVVATALAASKTVEAVESVEAAKAKEHIKRMNEVAVPNKNDSEFCVRNKPAWHLSNMFKSIGSLMFRSLMIANGIQQTVAAKEREIALSPDSEVAKLNPAILYAILLGGGVLVMIHILNNLNNKSNGKSESTVVDSVAANAATTSTFEDKTDSSELLGAKFLGALQSNP